MAHIVVSIPRLLFGTVFVAILAGSTQFFIPQSQAHQLHSQTTSDKHTVSTPYTAAPQPTAQPAPVPTPKVAAPVAKPVATISSTTQSVTAAPVVTAAPSASVSGLTPVIPTPSPSSGSGATSSGTTPPTTTTNYTSTNWSGYMAATGGYTAISGSWSVPDVTGISGHSSSDATWIGIGGISTDDLIQIGTQDSVSYTGHKSSSAFYELLPNSSRTITNLSISPGNVVAASLSELSSGQWQISITNTTTGQSYLSTVAYTSSRSSAEWIEEDPSNSFGRLVPFDNFGTISFTDASATSTGKSVTLATGDAQLITLINASGTAIATPSAIGSDGKSFSVTHS